MYQTPRITSLRILVADGSSSCLRKNILIGAHNSPAAASVVSRRGLSTAQAPVSDTAFSAKHNDSPKRRFSFTSKTTKEFFPEQSTPHIRITKPAWPHPIYTEEQMIGIKVAHREAKNWSDWVALGAIRALRFGLDIATGYKHERPTAQGQKTGVPKAVMDERKYMIRNVFLESVAGVPGMVAGMLRHLRSMRTMKRDNGWMETLLEESYNERMHLLTFLKMYEPGLFMRTMVLGAQGVFFNGFFLAYCISPRICHRFVGYLEEEAVLTYSRELADLDAGKLPVWSKTMAPDIAIKYWNMPEGHQTMRDLLLYIRADEAKHREVNHTLGNLDQKNDPNPFVSDYKDPNLDRPSKDIAHIKSTGWERKDII